MSVGRLPDTGVALALQHAIIVWGDSHFCSKQLMDWSHDKFNVHFITGLTCNRTLNANVLMHTLQEGLLKSKGLASVTRGPALIRIAGDRHPDAEIVEFIAVSLPIFGNPVP